MALQRMHVGCVRALDANFAAQSPTVNSKG